MKIQQILLLFLFISIEIGGYQEDRPGLDILQRISPEKDERIDPDSRHIQLYNYPPDAPSSVHYSAEINGRDYYVYPVPLVGRRSDGCKPDELFEPEILSFGIEEYSSGSKEVVIIIKSKDEIIDNFEVRPKRLNKLSRPDNSNYSATKTSDGSIKLIVKGPQMLSVEINGNIGKPLLVFANKTEDHIPPRDSCAYYFEEGRIHNIEEIELNSDSTVYIAPGAIVKGTFKTVKNASKVSIKGRGILSGESSPGKSLIALRNAGNCTIEGITLVNSRNWTMPVHGCSNIIIDGIRTVSNTGHEDGIDIVGCQNVIIRNCFIWTKDDCIAIKAGVNYNWDDKNSGIDGKKNVQNINVQNCVLWNGSHGNALEIGCELNTDVIEYITYDNIDIIHAQSPCNQDEGALSINNNGNATVQHVTYRNIYIEDVERYFINIKVEKTIYSPGGAEYQYNPKDPYSGGWVKDIVYENIYLDKVIGISLHSAIIDRLNDNRIRNIEFRNFRINNKIIRSYAGFDDRFSDKFALVLQGVSSGNVSFN